MNKEPEQQEQKHCRLTQEFNIPAGMRQGDNLNPHLFNIIMDQIIRNINELVVGYTIGNRSLRILCYAEDTVLAAQNE